MRLLIPLLLCLAATAAQAGTLTCSRVFDNRGIPTLFHVVAVGECTLSTAYAAGGDVFAGTGTAAQNAGETLCGQATDIPVFVTMSSLAGSFQLMFAYDYIAHKVQASAPTHSFNLAATMGGSAHLQGGSVTVDAFTPTASASVPAFTGNAAAVAGTNSAPSCSFANDGGTPDKTLSVKGGVLSYTAASGAPIVATGCAAPTFTGSNFTPAGTVAAPTVTVNAVSTATGQVTDVTVDVSALTASVALVSPKEGEEAPAGVDLSALGVKFRYLAYCN